MFLDEIQARLIAQGVGTKATIGKGSGVEIPSNIGQPGGPTAYMLLIETGGTGAVKTHNGTPVERPTMQLSARAMDYLSARAMLKAAYDALGGANGLFNVTLSGVFYQSITARQNITDPGGLDGAGRVVLSFNIDAEKQPS